MGSPGKVILAFLCVFAAGAVFGGFFTARTATKKIQEQPPVAATTVVPVAPAPTPAVATPPAPATPAAKPPANPNRGAALITPVMLQRLTVALKLTDEQKEKIQPAIKRAAEDMNYLRQENFRSTNRVLERMHAEIAVVLTPEQKTELEVQKRLIQERMKEAEKERRSEKILNREKLNPPANPADRAAKGN